MGANISPVEVIAEHMVRLHHAIEEIHECSRRFGHRSEDAREKGLLISLLLARLQFVEYTASKGFAPLKDCANSVPRVNTSQADGEIMPDAGSSEQVSCHCRRAERLRTGPNSPLYLVEGQLG